MTIPIRPCCKTLFNALMAWNDDAPGHGRFLEGLYYRAAAGTKNCCGKGVLVEGGIEAMQSLDDELISCVTCFPGGSADLLAVTRFLSHFPAGSPILSKFPLFFHSFSNDSSCGMNHVFLLIVAPRLSLISNYRRFRWRPGARAGYLKNGLRNFTKENSYA